MAVFGLRVRASVCGIVLRSACSELLAARVVVPGGRFPCLPNMRLRAAPRDATPLSIFRIVSRRRPSLSEDAALILDREVIWILRNFSRTQKNHLADEFDDSKLAAFAKLRNRLRASAIGT